MPAGDEVERTVDAGARELDLAPLQVLSGLARHLERARRTALAASGLKPWEFEVLFALRRADAPQLSPTSLRRHNQVSSGTMTNRIDRLVAHHLVERRTDPDDGRGILVIITEGGRERVDAAIASLLAMESERMERLPKADQERLGALLRELTRDFD